MSNKTNFSVMDRIWFHSKLESQNPRTSFFVRYLPPFCTSFMCFSSKLSRSCSRKFVLSIQIIVFKILHFTNPPFVYYRSEWRADLSVKMEISAREERISFIKCRLRYILEHPFRILVYPFLTT